MDSNKASFGTPLSCFIPEGATPVSMNQQPSTSSTIKKPRTFTPFSIIDIMKPDKYSPDESVGSSDSDSDALHIDLDRSSDEEQYLVQNDKMRSPADESTRSPADESTRSPAGESTRSPAGESTRSPAGESTRSPAGESTRSPAGESTRSPAVDTTRSPAVDTTRSPAVDTTRSPAVDTTRSPAVDTTRSPADGRETIPDVTIAQGMSPAITGSETSSNFTIYHGLANTMNIAHQGISPPQTVNNLYPMYPMSGVFPPAYPMFIPPATPQIPEGHLNSCHDPENVAPRVSPTCTGRVSPTDSSSSGDLCSPSPDTSPVTPSTKKTRKPAGGRTCYTQKQVRAMEQVFSENKYPDYDVIEQLSTETGIPNKRIKVWFQNKRARRKCRVPETQHLNSPHMAAMMSSSPGFNYLSPMMPQFHYPVSTPAMMSPFPGFPCTPVYPSTVC